MNSFSMPAPADPSVQELQSIITALSHLPSRGDRTPERVIERYREKKIIRMRLANVVKESPQVRAFLEENVRICNGTKGDPRSFDLLDGLLDDQAYRLAYWRVASEEINYRRFFDINELAAIRMEDPAVFEESHQLIFRLLKEGCVTGLRIDHVDGLYNPGGYLKQLQNWASKEFRRRQAADQKHLFVVVEKILGQAEVLPDDWPVFGTTGYDFLARLNGLFVDRGNERAFDEIYNRFIRNRLSYEELAYEKKKLIMGVSMSSELNVLGHDLDCLSERDRWSRDFTLNNLTHVIREIIACFPVYRTYVTESQERVTERDRAYIQLAVAKAKRRNPALSGVAFDFVRDLLLKLTEDWSPQDRRERLQFVMKFQQTTSPVTAKGIEDTVFYIYNRLASLNEVGGEPSQFGLPLAAFHEWMRERQAHWPHSLSATSTHDTKRSEDVRARINVLSELPKVWRAQLATWAKLNKRHKTEMEGQPAPDGNEEYLLYQTLIGAWPLSTLDDTQYRTFCDRIQSYMTKALREAKVHTSWVNPEQGYENAVRGFIEAILDRSQANPFLDALLPFQETIAQYGMTNSLSQVILKVAAPGIPDFYQGAELWAFNLVDPDNRYPVDFGRRAEFLTALRRAVADAGTDRRSLVRGLVEARADGRIKMYITAMALEFRRDHPALFSEGDYVPLESRGSQSGHLCAFTRIYRDQAVVTVVPRLVAGLSPEAKGPPMGTEVWSDTHVTVPSWKGRSRYRNVLTGEMLTTVEIEGSQALPVAQVLGVLPVALLERMS